MVVVPPALVVVRGLAAVPVLVVVSGLAAVPVLVVVTGLAAVPVLVIVPPILTAEVPDVRVIPEPTPIELKLSVVVPVSLDLKE